MKSIQTILISATGILLINTIVCGFWMRYSGKIIGEADKNFHMISGTLTIFFVAVTLFLMARR
jgi:hypothetical protein